MLTAKTKSGSILNLGNHYKKEELLILRKKEKFFCPVCGETLSLKVGNQRIYHFSHRSNSICREIFEAETPYHLAGKLQLYHWLIKQQIPAELEYYDPIIGQRPDIMFHYDGHRYALEFQCSPLSEELFTKRSQCYFKQNYIPFWIIGSKHIKEKRKNVYSLSNFEYFFLRSTKDKQLILPSYCPEKKQFQILSSIYPYSIKNATATRLHLPIQHRGIDEILAPKWDNYLHYSQWRYENEKFLINFSLHPNPNQASYLRELYSRNLNFYLLPPEIGLPVSHSLLIQTPPIVWQTYIFLDCFQGKSQSDLIHLKEVERKYNQRIDSNEVTLRKIPQLPDEDSFIAVKEYFLQLEKLGVVTKRNEALYQVQNIISIPQSNREKEERRNEFYQKSKSILTN